MGFYKPTLGLDQLEQILRSSYASALTPFDDMALSRFNCRITSFSQILPHLQTPETQNREFANVKTQQRLSIAGLSENPSSRHHACRSVFRSAQHR
jgi:hypothetical protein